MIVVVGIHVVRVVSRIRTTRRTMAGIGEFGGIVVLRSYIVRRMLIQTDAGHSPGLWRCRQPRGQTAPKYALLDQRLPALVLLRMLATTVPKTGKVCL